MPDLQRRITELTEQAAIEPGVFVPIDSTLRGTRKFDLGTLVAGLAGQYPIWDEESGCYTNESIHNWLDARNDGLAYGISIPKTASTECVKTGANAGIANPVPGTVGTPAVDPYVGRGAFRFYNVNATVDADGTPHVTAIEGDGRFRRDGSNGDVWVMAPVLYWTYDDSDTEAVTFSVSDSRLSATSQFALDERSLFKAGDAEDLARKIDWWIEHPKEKEEMEHAYAESANQYTLEHSVQACVRMFEAAIEEHYNGGLSADLRPVQANTVSCS